MTKDEAVTRVAAQAAAFLQVGGFKEATGLAMSDISAADLKLLNEAVDEVTRRLRGMGRK